MPRALFVCYGGGHAKMVLPLAQAMRQTDAWHATVLALTTAGPEIERAGIPTVGFRHLVGPGDEIALEHGRRLAGESHDPSASIPLEESVAYLGLSYADIIERLGAIEAEGRYAEHGRHAFLPLGPLRRAVDRWTPDVVVTTNSPKSERAALVVAEERGIPSIAMEDLLGIRQKIIRSFVPPMRADRVCVASSIAIENLERDEGVPAERIRLTGNPSFDRLAGVAARRGAVRANMGLDGARLAVIFTQAYTLQGPVAELAESLGRVSGLRVAIRRHPSRRATSPQEYLASMPAGTTLVDDVALDDVLAATDVAVGVSTTTLVESVLVSRPVVQLGPGCEVTETRFEVADDLPLYRYGATLLAERRSAVVERVREALEDESRARLIARGRELFVEPGRATRAILEEMSDLAKHG